MITIAKTIFDPALKPPREQLPLEVPLHNDEEEKTDYSYDPDDEWIRMHLDEKMEENY